MEPLFNINHIKKIFPILFLQLLSSCSQIPQTRSNIKDLAVQSLIKSLKPQLESVFLEEAPVTSPERSSYPSTRELPGSSFSPNKVTQGELLYDANGKLLLSSGDYVIPVMTFCMNPSGKSPDGHIYSLSKLEGKRAAIIRSLNLLAPPKFSIQDIQIVSWSLQTGLSYQEMTGTTQKIIDDVIPQFKPLLTESFLSVLEKKWNRVSSSSRGLLPTFEDSFNDFAGELGEVGQKIKDLREFKERLHESGHDYSRLSELIEITSNLNKKEISETSWSKISSNVYARFVTDGHYQQIGFVQIRILVEGKKREVSSISNKKTTVDLASLLANPNTGSVQPLAFSPLYGFAGVLTVPALAEVPLAATILLTAILAAKVIDWDVFLKLYDLLKDSDNSQVQKELDKGMKTLQKAHDELDKLLKEERVISGKTKNTSTKEKNEVREYTKSGGDEELQKYFDKLPGQPTKAKDGIEYKILPNGNKAVKRPADKDGPATLEVQPHEIDLEMNSRLRVKVRYL
jgi:hypothetical protein